MNVIKMECPTSPLCIYIIERLEILSGSAVWIMVVSVTVLSTHFPFFLHADNAIP